jgi:TetR/AcrR family transcriptional regulator, cholesterol catabolism regulator
MTVSRRGALNEERWEEILIAATEVFDEKGYQATTLKDVGARVGLQTGSLYYYIDSKEDLLAAVLRRAHASGLPLMEEPASLAAADAPTRLLAFIQRWVPDAGKDPAFGRILERDLQHLTPAHRAEIIETRRQVGIFVRDLVVSGIAEGSFDPDLDPVIVTMSLLELLNSTFTWHRPGGPRSLEEVFDWYGTLFVRGLARVPVEAERILAGN